MPGEESQPQAGLSSPVPQLTGQCPDWSFLPHPADALSSISPCEKPSFEGNERWLIGVKILMPFSYAQHNFKYSFGGSCDQYEWQGLCEDSGKRVDATLIVVLLASFESGFFWKR
jgi:hypothetical protein